MKFRISLFIILLVISSATQIFQATYNKLKTHQFIPDNFIYLYANIEPQKYDSAQLQYTRYQQDFVKFQMENFLPDPHYSCSFYLDGQASIIASFFFSLKEVSTFKGEISIDQYKNSEHENIGFQIFNLQKKKFQYASLIYYVDAFSIELEAGQYMGMMNSLNQQIKLVRFQAKEIPLIAIQQVINTNKTSQQFYKKISLIHNTVDSLLDQHQIDIIEVSQHKNKHYFSSKKQFLYTMIELGIIIITNIVQFVYIRKLFQNKSLI